MIQVANSNRNYGLLIITAKRQLVRIRSPS